MDIHCCFEKKRWKLQMQGCWDDAEKMFFSKKNMEIVTILQMLLPYLAGGLEHDFYLSISYMG
jgi:hypothetical protein